MADWSVSVPMTLSDLERRNARGQNFQADLLNDACTVWPRTTKFGRITQLLGRGVFPGVSYAPTARCGTPHFPSFGVPFYLCTHSLTQNYQIWRGNTYGEGACSKWSGTPKPNGMGSQRSPILGVLLCLCLHLLTQNYQIRHGDTYREGRVFRSATPLHLHKCVARLSATAEFLVTLLTPHYLTLADTSQC